MVCRKCGKELEQGVKFCTQCGAPAEANAENKAPVKKKGKVRKFFRRVFLTVCALLAVIVIILIIGVCQLKNRSSVVPNPGVLLNQALEKEYDDDLVSIVLSSDNVKNDPVPAIKEYVHALVEDYGFEVAYASDYRSSTNTYLYYRVEYDVNFLEETADAFFGMYDSVPTIYIRVEQKNANDPYDVRFEFNRNVQLAE